MVLDQNELARRDRVLRVLGPQPLGRSVERRSSGADHAASGAAADDARGAAPADAALETEGGSVENPPEWRNDK